MLTSELLEKKLIDIMNSSNCEYDCIDCKYNGECKFQSIHELYMSYSNYNN